MKHFTQANAPIRRYANNGLDIYDELNNHIGAYVETRVALVVDDLTHPCFDPNTCSDGEFYDRAEEQGTVFSLNHFEKFIYEGKLNAMTQELASTQYLFPRFIRIFEHPYSKELFIGD